MIQVGDRVEKITGDYHFDGIVVASFKKLSGKERFVVENYDGILHIFSEGNLKHAKKKDNVGPDS